MKRVHYIDMGAIPLSVGVVFSEKTYLRAVRKLKVQSPSAFVSKGADACVHSFENDIAGMIALICIGEIKKRSASQIAAIIAHEATHVMQFAKEAMREERAGAEFEAYLVQHVTQQTLDAYRKRKKHG